MPIPHTRTRLKGFVTLRTVPGGVFQPNAANLPALTIVGAAQYLMIDQERDTNNLRREFDPNLLGKPAETYPGLARFNIELKRVDLYDTTLYEAFGIAGNNIVDQFKPIVIVAEQPVPVDAQGNPLTVNDGTGGSKAMKARTYIIPGCWFNRLPVEFNIDDADQKFVAEVALIAQDVVVTG